MNLDDVLTVLDALERADVRYAVFGGLAMAAHGFDRGTRDLDLFVRPDPDNIARLRAALTSVYDDPDIAAITAEDLAGEFPAVQYGPPDVDYTIDIVSRLGDAFRFEDLEIERIQAGNVTITVVTPNTLYEMKRDTVRLRDRDDAQRLARAFGFDRDQGT
ncbi:MAG: nucleotidyl transferase AbiEii/AbiGii toxin family protein [Nitriliruptoraceae bacterium]